MSDEIILVDFGGEFDTDEFESKALGFGSASEKVTDLIEKSSNAIDKAMVTIKGMASKTVDTIKELSEPPTKVVVSFGIKLDASAGAYLTKAGTEASIEVTLEWTKKS